MPRVTYVAAAQQRYKTVPVMNEDGTPKVVPVMDKRTGQQKVTKTGRPVTMNVTRNDTTQPLPPERCDFPGCDITDRQILPGQPYQWIQPKSGPYGGRKMSRHAEHRAWYQWEYSQSLGANIARIQHEAHEAIDQAADADDVKSALDQAASEIRELADAKKEAAENIENGFGQATYQSDELAQQGDDLENWADEIEQVDVPDLPEPEERYFVYVDDEKWDGNDDEGYETEDDAIAAAEDADLDEPEDGWDVRLDTPEDASTDQIEEWRQEVNDAAEILDESPV